MSLTDVFDVRFLFFSRISISIFLVWGYDSPQNVCTPKKRFEGEAGIGDIALRGDDKIVATAGWDYRYVTLVHSFIVSI